MTRTARWTIPALAALVAPVVVPAASATAGAEAEDPPNPYCYTELLTIEEAEAGATSTIECYDEPLVLRGTIVAATHYVGWAGKGIWVQAIGTSCSGTSTEWAGTGWNDAIYSTANVACANSKHFRDANRAGPSEVVSSTAATNLTTLAGATTSVAYA